jgi:predicted ATPase
LRTVGEWVQRLGPLAVPPVSSTLRAAEALEYPAVQLFIQRLLSCHECGELSDADTAVVAEICTRLDGLPLAIELAAARVRVFGLRGLAERLDDRFSILTQGRRTALPRHQTLAAMIDWSYGTLSEEEKVLWCRFAVFRGAFTIEAAAAIGNDPSGHYDIVDILGSLLEKSLLSVDVRGGETRYRLLESLRFYALDKLSEHWDPQAVRRRHAQYWYERSVGSGGDWQQTPTPEWLLRKSGDIADIRAALEWTFSPPGDPILGIRITAACAPLWFKMLLLPELRQYLEHAIQLAPRFTQIEETLVMQLHLALANSIFHTLGAVREVAEALDAALAIAERGDDINSQVQIAARSRLRS